MRRLPLGAPESSFKGGGASFGRSRRTSHEDFWVSMGSPWLGSTLRSPCDHHSFGEIYIYHIYIIYHCGLVQALQGLDLSIIDGQKSQKSWYGLECCIGLGGAWTCMELKLRRRPQSESRSQVLSARQAEKKPQAEKKVS